MITKKVTAKRKVVAPPPPSSSKSLPTAVLGMGMVILTNYQAEVKQVLALIVKTLT
jgi:hypothetical protein